MIRKLKKKLFLMFLLMISSAAIFAQSGQGRTITGIVTDKNGEPLIGGSINVKNEKVGTVTDINGAYSISVKNNNAILVFSYLGFNTQEQNVGARQQINVTLNENAELLDEVVVVGYGVQKKKLITGATVQVGGEDIQKLSMTNSLNALQSQSPGVNIVQSSGQPGENYKVTIRGLGTNGDSKPLYVIDGIPGGDLNYLTPSEIESIDVLKDAASAAIYGSRAANGVILVTTKQGKSGKLQLSYDGYIGWQNVYKMASLLDAREYMMIQDEIRFNNGNTSYNWASLIPKQYESIMNGSWNGTNWLEETRAKNAPIGSHAFNLSGGTDISRFSMNFSYSTQDGILGKPAQPKYERTSARINSDHILLKGKNYDIIKIGENLSYSFSKKSGIGIGNMGWNDLYNILQANPLLPMYNDNGSFYDNHDKVAENWTLDGSAGNPIAEMVYRRGQNLNKSHSVMANIYVEIQPIKDLKLRSSYGYNMNASSYRHYVNPYALSVTKTATEEINQSQSNDYGWTFENILSYSFNIAEKHHFDAVIGQSVQKWGLGESVSAKTVDSKFSGLWDYAWIDNGATFGNNKIAVGGGPMSRGCLSSFFGRINYNLKESYLLTLIMRADGSSNFARGHRWGYFPSLSAGWIITNESFMEGTKSWLDFLKPRISWGQNGNSNIANFQYLATVMMSDANSVYYFSNDKISYTSGAYPDILPNPELTWETSEQLNVGLDARFLNSRLGLIFDWYRKITKDWLVTAPTLSSYGTGAPVINGGDVENKGVEIGLNWKDNISKFHYGVGFNLSQNKNKVTRLANNGGVIEGSRNVLSYGTDILYRAQVGYPLGYFYGYKTAGIFQNYDEVTKAKAKLDGAQPGDVIFVDTNHDGLITEADKVQIGNPHPDVTIGFNLNMSYKGFDFSITGTGAFGHQIAKSYRSFVDQNQQNYTTDIFKRWHGEGTSNRLPRLTNGSHPNWSYISDIHIEDADYVKIQNVTLGYDFKKIWEKMPFSQARFYVTAQNLFTFTKYSGMDPEVGYAADSWASGIDLGFYPSPRTIIIGANLKF